MLLLRPRGTQSKPAKQARNRGFHPNPHRHILMPILPATEVTVVQGPGSMSAIAFHEKAGRRQVDFDLPFLKFPFPSWRRVAVCEEKGRTLLVQPTFDGL
jgi:hypothetical protein